MQNIRYFHIYNNQLTDTLPAGLERLQKLEVLNLNNNQLEGPVPPELALIKNLQRLQLTNNRLSGGIPAELGDLENLVSLTLDRNSLTGPIPINLGNLKKLQTLYLYNNKLTGFIPPGLGRMERLSNLALFGNNLTGSIPPQLGNLHYLTELRLESNLLSGPVPSELNNLPLTNFSLRANYFTAGDLLPVKEMWIDANSYAPQKNMDPARAYQVGQGGTLTLQADTDLNTEPPSEYQWFRGSQALNTRSASGHTLVLDNVAVNQSGNYTFRIWNADLPALTLTSAVQNVQVQSPGWKSLTVDLMSHNRKEGSSSVLRKTLLNTVPNTPYSLSYELSGLGTELEGIGCSSCSFELEIMLLDPKGHPVSLGIVTGNTAPDSFSYRNSYTVDDCMVEQTEATVDIAGIVLKDIGDYTVVKELRLLSPTATQAMAEIRSSPVFAGQLAALDILISCTI